MGKAPSACEITLMGGASYQIVADETQADIQKHPQKSIIKTDWSRGFHVSGLSEDEVTQVQTHLRSGKFIETYLSETSDAGGPFTRFVRSPKGKRLLKVTYDKKLTETDGGIKIEFLMRDKTSLNGQGSYAKKSLQESSYAVEVTSRGPRLDVVFVSSSVSKHPGGIAKMLLSDSSFFEKAEKSGEAAFFREWKKLCRAFHEVLTRVS